MIVLICGDRLWTNKGAIKRELRSLIEEHEDDIDEIEVVEGEAPGADSLGRQVAEELGLRVHKFPAEWHKLGRAAGPVRNTTMLRYLLTRKQTGAQILVMAFHSDLEHSKGTKNMVMQAEKAHVEVWKFKE